MKRSGWLQRRTPLARSGGLPPVSRRRRGERDERLAVVEQAMRQADGVCQGRDLVPEVGCWGPLDAHEVIPRGVRPGSHLEPALVLVLCRVHHEWAHAHPQEAARRGLRQWSWER